MFIAILTQYMFCSFIIGIGLNENMQFLFCKECMFTKF